jgi:hypothetical protein
MGTVQRPYAGTGTRGVVMLHPTDVNMSLGHFGHFEHDPNRRSFSNPANQFHRRGFKFQRNRYPIEGDVGIGENRFQRTRFPVRAIGVNAETKLHTFSLQQRKLIYSHSEDKYNTILQNKHQAKTKKCMCITPSLGFFSPTSDD